MTVVVAGALANKPGSGGEAWVRMSWVVGLERLGLDVRFVEQLTHEPAADSRAVVWFRDVTERFGIADRATLLGPDGALLGPAVDELREFASTASLVNISGHLTDARLFAAFRRRVMIDIDPGFTQFWHAQGLAGSNVDGHDMYFTIGELIGTPGCSIPTGGIEWLPVRQPVVLEDWPVTPAADHDRFTTVGGWRGPFGPIEHEGRRYGLKLHEFRKMIELPRRSPQRFELALSIDPADAADRERLLECGWDLVDPAVAAGSPDAFRAYVQGSGAEFSVAQGIYVDTACGWFSDRTVRYLASGKPALVQETGFSETLGSGEGLLSFANIAQASAGAAAIVERYAEHAAAARRLAEQHFDSDRILAWFCERAGIE